jgi:hypothetical protein
VTDRDRRRRRRALEHAVCAIDIELRAHAIARERRERGGELGDRREPILRCLRGLRERSVLIADFEIPKSRIFTIGEPSGRRVTNRFVGFTSR